MKIVKRLKYKLIKRFLLWRQGKNTVVKLDDIQQKSVDLFKLYLRNPETNLVCSFASGKRHIDIDDVLLMLNNTQRGYTLTVIDENRNNSINCYEVNLPDSVSFELINLFDTKMERRLVASESSKKGAISKDLSLLIEMATKNITQNARPERETKTELSTNKI